MNDVKRVKALGEITKLVLWTDIHFGARNNSEQHNNDCLDYGDWLISIVEQERPSHIAFLGDFFENRNAVNIKTLNAASTFCRKLDALNIPIIFIIGNHDLYHRSDRKIFSTNIFKDLKNFFLISEPIELSKDFFAAPFLFKDEYPLLASQINGHKYVLGHFEFRNFVVTGATRTLEHGPDASLFKGPKYIFSGHFHKRQHNKNIVYIGNTFPTNYGDVEDSARGCAVLDIKTDEVYFHDWEKAPLFFKTKLSRVLEGDIGWPDNSRIRCLLDVDIGYTDVQALRDEMMDTYNLREFCVEEDVQARSDALTGGLDFETELDVSSLDSTVRQLINEGVAASATIDPKLLVSIYENLHQK